jgi:DNA-binding response OmpR family regulator
MTGATNRMRVLVVEDEALIALDIARQLTAAGFQVVGPAISVARALKLIGDGGCDIAVLDVNLGDKETSEPIAHELRARATPFIVLSGYARDEHPQAFQGAPMLSKPASSSELVATLLSCAAPV